jgi:argininosuccinate lyase
VLSQSECAQICAGLDAVQAEFASGAFAFSESDEDIHTAVERRLTELAGPVAGKLHTGRSRNDQVVTDFRWWLMHAIDQIDPGLHDLQAALVARAESDGDIILPGYTHFQRAQPILLSHWWLSHFWPLARDRERLAQLRDRTTVLPLGAGALAGTPFAIDRKQLAHELGFATVSPNSVDAVSDRDFATEFLFVAAMIAVHLSRLSEALIVYSTAEFDFIELADAFSTGSSLMPQKKNPDTLELTRGKTGTLIGHLTGLLSTLKGLPSAYDKDLQEDKLPVFDAAGTLLRIVPAMTGVIMTLTIHADRMKAALDPNMLATDLADYLVVRGVPFREAHRLVGRAVKRAIELGVTIDRLPLKDLRSISPIFNQDVVAVFDFQASIDRRNATGGTSHPSVQVQRAQAREYLNQH